jgi:Na+-transporting methylmalonyl-CoA/oxaloacetate decarboxylase gamma subunit
MTTAIIILSLLALIVLGIGRAIRQYNLPKDIAARDEKRQHWYDFREWLINNRKK